VLPFLASARLMGAGRVVGRGLGRLGLRAGTDVAEIARGHASLSDREARAAFVHTLRTMVDPGGQRVNASDRLYLAENVPFLLIWGERDSVIPVEPAYATHELVKSSRLEVFSKAGHFPQLDEPPPFLDVLGTAVGEVVDAWVQAIDGPDDPLAACTTPEALRALLYPTASGRDRLVIRGVDVKSMTIVAVTPGTLPEVRLQLDVVGVQYVEDRDTTEIMAGSKRRRSRTQQDWTLRLSDDPRRPWVVVDAVGVVPR